MRCRMPGPIRGGSLSIQLVFFKERVPRYNSGNYKASAEALVSPSNDLFFETLRLSSGYCQSVSNVPWKRASRE